MVFRRGINVEGVEIRLRVKISDRLKGVIFGVEVRRSSDWSSAISNIIVSTGFNTIFYNNFNNKEFNRSAGESVKEGEKGFR